MRYPNQRNLKTVQEYQNRFGQTIRVGDIVYYPTWTGGLEKGQVVRIKEYEYDWHDYSYDATGKYSSKVIVKTARRASVVKTKEYRPYNKKTNQLDSPVTYLQTVTIGRTERLVKLAPPEVVP